MRKRIIPSAEGVTSPSGEDWLDLEAIAEVEITSEDPAHPVESALVRGEASGWRASGPGEQTIRLLFTAPQTLHRIWLEFIEPTVERTQEFVLRWSPDGGRPSTRSCASNGTSAPQDSPRQTEDHRVELTDVTLLELSIVPDIGAGTAHASLAQLRIA